MEDMHFKVKISLSKERYPPSKKSLIKFWMRIICIL